MAVSSAAHSSKGKARSIAALAESKRLRKMVMDFNEQGSPLLKVPNLETPRTAMREGIKRRVSGLLESAQALVTGGSSSR